MRRILVHAILFATVFGAAPALRAAECKMISFGTLPVELQGSQPTTVARINGREARFLVDTGAWFGTMSRATAEEHALTLSAAPFGLRGEGVGGSFNLQMARVRQLGILGATLPNIEFTVGGTDFGIPILGANLLHAFDLELDLAKGQMRLMKPSNCTKMALAYWAGDGAFQMAELAGDMNRRGRSVRVKVLINGKPVEALLDTGASATLISRSAAQRVGLDVAAPNAVGGSTTMGFGRSLVRTWTVPVATIAIGSETIQRAKIQVLDGEFGAAGSDRPDMLLGIDFILAHHIYVASSQGRLYFTYNGGPVFASGIEAATAKAVAAKDPGPTNPASSGAPHGETAGALASATDYALRGKARVARGDVNGGLADLAAAVRLEPGKATHHLSLAAALAAAGESGKALASYDQALTLEPTNLDALLERAELRWTSGNRPGALADARAAEQQATPGTQRALAIAEFYVANDEPALALPHYDAWIRLHPADARLGSVLNSRCWARGLANQVLDGALEDCRKAIKRDGPRASYLDSQGLVQLRLRAYAEAIASYRQALDKAPANAWSRYGIGLARIASGEVEAGQADLAAAKALEPGIADRFKSFGF